MGGGPVSGNPHPFSKIAEFRLPLGLGVHKMPHARKVKRTHTLVTANTLFQHQKDDSTRGHYRMVNTEIRLILFFKAEDGEALYSQQKQDQELTVAQVMNSLLQNIDLNSRK